MKNNNSSNNQKERRGNEVVTIFNFECKNCQEKIGQLVSNNIDEKEVVCPKCGSNNVTYGTLLK